MSPDLNPTDHLWDILKWKVEEHQVSNLHQLHDVVMGGWKRFPGATCGTQVNSMPKTVKKSSSHTKNFVAYFCRQFSRH